MHDINKIREDKKIFLKDGRRGLSINLDEILEIDKELRLKMSKIQDLQEKEIKFQRMQEKQKSDKDESFF